jgi:hypothetical protein
LWQESYSKEAHKRGAGNRFVQWQNIWCRRWFYLPIGKDKSKSFAAWWLKKCEWASEVTSR